MKNKKTSGNNFVFKQINKNLQIAREELNVVHQQLTIFLIILIVLLGLSLNFSHTHTVEIIFLLLYVVIIISSIIVCFIGLFSSTYSLSNNVFTSLNNTQNIIKIKQDFIKISIENQETLNKKYRFQNKCLKSIYILLIIALLFFTVNIFLTVLL
jgi:hypothetical protein